MTVIHKRDESGSWSDGGGDAKSIDWIYNPFNVFGQKKTDEEEPKEDSCHVPLDWKKK